MENLRINDEITKHDESVIEAINEQQEEKMKNVYLLLLEQAEGLLKTGKTEEIISGVKLISAAINIAPKSIEKEVRYLKQGLLDIIESYR